MSGQLFVHPECSFVFTSGVQVTIQTPEENLNVVKDEEENILIIEVSGQRHSITIATREWTVMIDNKNGVPEWNRSPFKVLAEGVLLPRIKHFNYYGAFASAREQAILEGFSESQADAMAENEARSTLDWRIPYSELLRHLNHIQGARRMV